MKNKKILYVIRFILLAAVLYSFSELTQSTDHSYSFFDQAPIADSSIVNSQNSLSRILPFPATRNITIFIHGTRLMRFFPLNILKKLTLLDQCLSTPKSGLHHFLEIPKNNNQIKIATTLNRVAPDLFPLESFYLFGWSGKLDIKERRSAAKTLIADIDRMIVTPFREKHGIDPIITIISHSHGGNVALNMVRNTPIDFCVENLILLACPVQNQTKRYSKSPVFKNIYSIFSKDDMLQVMDLQPMGFFGHKVKKAWNKKSTDPLKGLWKMFKLPFFSKRKFESSTNTYHIEVSWKDAVHWTEADFDIYANLRGYGKRLTKLDMSKRRGLRHIEFLIPTFIEKLPAILNEAQRLKKDFSFFI